MLDHSGKPHDVAGQCDVERLERATDNLSNSWETFVEWWQVCFYSLYGYPFCALSPNPTIKTLI